MDLDSFQSAEEVRIGEEILVEDHRIALELAAGILPSGKEAFLVLSFLEVGKDLEGRRKGNQKEGKLRAEVAQLRKRRVDRDTIDLLRRNLALRSQIGQLKGFARAKQKLERTYCGNLDTFPLPILR